MHCDTHCAPLLCPYEWNQRPSPSAAFSLSTLVQTLLSDSQTSTELTRGLCRPRAALFHRQRADCAFDNLYFFRINQANSTNCAVSISSETLDRLLIQGQAHPVPGQCAFSTLNVLNVSRPHVKMCYLHQDTLFLAWPFSRDISLSWVPARYWTTSELVSCRLRMPYVIHPACLFLLIVFLYSWICICYFFLFVAISGRRPALSNAVVPSSDRLLQKKFLRSRDRRLARSARVFRTCLWPRASDRCSSARVSLHAPRCTRPEARASRHVHYLITWYRVAHIWSYVVRTHPLVHRLTHLHFHGSFEGYICYRI